MGYLLHTIIVEWHQMMYSTEGVNCLHIASSAANALRGWLCRCAAKGHQAEIISGFQKILFVDN